MASALAVGRARSDIDVVSRAGLPLHQFADEATSALQSVVPFIAACVSTLDPATTMVSGTRKLGELTGRNESDVVWSQIEYGADDPTAITAMLRAGQIAVSVHEATDGAVERSVRFAELLVPNYDFRDEARVVFTDRAGAWGHVSLFRTDDDASFSPDEIAFLAAIAPAFTRGIRTGLLAQLSRADGAPRVGGPAVMIVDAHDRVVQSTPGALAHLAAMSTAPGTGDPLTYVHALVSGAACSTSHTPSFVRARTRGIRSISPRAKRRAPLTSACT